MRNIKWFIALVLAVGIPAVVIGADLRGPQIQTSTIYKNPLKIFGSISVGTTATELVLDTSGNIVAEGSTADAYETTIGVTDPTADRTITFPDASGNLAVFSNAGTPDVSLVFEGATADDYETTVTVTDPTADRTITIPDYTGAVPVVVQQGYTQFSHSEATTVDVTGATLTLADGWFTEGKTFRVRAGGTVTNANGTVSVALYLEDGAVMTLTTADGAAGDWTADFTVIATGAATQRIIGHLIAEAGAEVKTDYAADTTDTTTAGTIPLTLQVGLGHADDTITCEYWSIEYWNKSD